MLPIVAEYAQEAATKTQVIFTTQSPQFLDAFENDLPTTTLCNCVGDRTEIKTGTGDELKKWVEDYTLGQFFFSGEANAVL